MNIAKALIGRACLVLVLAVFGSILGVAFGQIDEANGASVAFTTLHSFSGPDGSYAQSGLLKASNGYLYGTTLDGGANGCVTTCGAIFQISPGGTVTTLYTFCSQSACADGQLPQHAGLVQATNGYLYGTTGLGGANQYGTIFKITPSGKLTTLYSFCSQSACADGAIPAAGLVQSANGDLYGTTYTGGAYGGGTIFKMTPSGLLTTLYNFCAQSGCTDGYGPQGSLVQARNGELFGTTAGGGNLTGCGASYFVGPGCGTVFKISPSGTVTTLYRFCSKSSCVDGQQPTAGLIQATNGDLYGTTYNGGANCVGAGPISGCGTIFKITPSGSFTTVHSFCVESGCADGEYPDAGLIQATDGNLYGAASVGGSGLGGTIFKITPSGKLTTLYSFCSQSGCADGLSPFAGLVQDTDGNLYGTTSAGGANDYGTVFMLSVGLGSFVDTRPAIGVVGEVVTILGYGLKGATSVTFNGTSATILYDAPTVIYAKVPTGAKTGKVQVVTPSGTLTSNVAFEVAP